MRTIEYTIASRFDGAKVKDVLSGQLLVSDALCSRLKRRENGILLNGAPVYVTHPVQTGDRLMVAVGDGGKDPRIVPMPAPLSVVYEDDDLLVIDKPAGLSVHPARDPNEVTLENALAAYLGDDENPHPVSRLDKGTTGLLTVAKSGWAHSFMKPLQHAGNLHKTYLAIAIGRPASDFGEIDAPIGNCPGSTYRRAVCSDGAPSRSSFTVLQSWDGLSLVRLVPHTGRTHQLRVHMAYIGCPLLGDWLYGQRDPRIDRPALHAAELSFRHPLTGEQILLTAPLSTDMAELLS
ncbi:MAG: RluA family pseudouridine synthase [Clostridia bacterium]|nr:RluA family pseudouridine synthase [Clostridia bacterium]